MYYDEHGLALPTGFTWGDLQTIAHEAYTSLRSSDIESFGDCIETEIRRDVVRWVLIAARQYRTPPDPHSVYRRSGMFEISELILSQEPILIQEILAQVIVTKCDYDYVTKRFIYRGYSHLFEEKPANELPPHYKIEFDKNTRQVVAIKTS